MGFLGGLIVGLFVGGLVGIFTIAIASANSRAECDYYERAKHCNSVDKNKVKDRNEF